MLYMTGGVRLPGSRIQIADSLGSGQYLLLFLVFALVLLIILPLIGVVLWRTWQKRDQLSLKSPAHWLLLALFQWVIAHNLLYVVFLAMLGAADRYAPMNHILFWERLLAGVQLLPGRVG